MYILIVTWFVLNQPATTFQTQFSGQAECEAAASQIKAEADRFKQEQLKRDAENRAVPGAMYVAPGSVPKVIAICAKQ